MDLLLRNLNHWDQIIFERIYGLNGRKFWDAFMWTLSKLGSGGLYVAVAIFIAVFSPQNIRLIPAIAISQAMTVGMQIVLKKKFKRPRPYQKIPGIRNLIRTPADFSFPSGHSASAYAMATLMSSAFPGMSPLFFGIASLIGISRVYNGVHYPGDVLAGAVLGMTCGLIAA